MSRCVKAEVRAASWPMGSRGAPSTITSNSGAPTRCRADDSDSQKASDDRSP